MASRSLGDLHPLFRPHAAALLAQAAAADIPLTVTCTLRSMAEQASLYAQGRTAPGRIVTNARPGYSFHNFGLAIDVVPNSLIGLPQWGDAPDHRVAADALWRRLGAIGRGLGLNWGGDFASLADRPHFQWSNGLSLAQLRNGARPVGPTTTTLQARKELP